MKHTMGAALAVTALCGSVLVAAPAASAGVPDDRDGTTEEVWGNDPTPDQSRAEAREQSLKLATEARGSGKWLTKRFAREKARYGDRDRSPRSMHHVRELQYRLRWAKVYKGPVTGYFGPRTRKAVRRYQHRADLKRSGVATRATWRKLIRKTVRGRKDVPRACRSDKSRGPHICYDRRRHQVSLWRSGKLWNTWLVRGGDRGYKTRTGNFRVYYKNKDHVSSLYDSPMPNSQFFSGGQAFHGSPFMTDPFSGHSHGCVNMYIQDSRQLWKLTRKKLAKVHIRGRWS